MLVEVRGIVGSHFRPRCLSSAKGFFRSLSAFTETQGDGQRSGRPPHLPVRYESCDVHGSHLRVAARSRDPSQARRNYGDNNALPPNVRTKSRPQGISSTLTHIEGIHHLHARPIRMRIDHAHRCFGPPGKLTLRAIAQQPMIIKAVDSAGVQLREHTAVGSGLRLAPVVPEVSTRKTSQQRNKQQA